MLDLTFLATGYHQHVFTSTGDADDGWVYKIPAAFGYILSFQQPFQVFYPRNRREKALHVLVRALPRRLQRFGRGKPLAYISSRLSNFGETALAAYCRRARRRAFHAMLDEVERLDGLGLGEVLLPFRIERDLEAVLRVDGRTPLYRGPALLQRRTDCLFENGESVRMFRWDELVEAQQLLWRHGAAFSHQRDIIGPRSWALWKGRLHLADTSALTRDARVARRCLSGEYMDAKQRQILQSGELCASDPAEEYFRYIRRGINQQTFDELWQADSSPSAHRLARKHSGGDLRQPVQPRHGSTS